MLAIWNLAQGVRTHRENIRVLCAANGTLAYMLEGDKKAAFFGAPGHEAPVDYRRVSHITCQPRRPDADPDRDIVPLLAQHGALDRGSRRGHAHMDNASILLFRPEASQGIDIGLKHWDTEGVSYYPFKGAYLITSQFYDPVRRVTLSPWPAGTPRPLWWMTSEGRVTRFTVPPPWSEVPEYFPTRAGIVVAATDPRKSGARFPRDAGLFLLHTDGSVQTLLQGETHRVAIAPGGCLVAFVHVEVPLKYDSAKLKVMRVCS